MREIKFRFYNKSEPERYIDVPEMEYMTLDDMFNEDINSTSDFYIMQYTGLKDKNGIEIYECDIIYTGYEKAEVVFNDGCFMFIDKDKNEEYLYTWIEDIRVIGNIYENEELLNEA